ncbi:MAG TPA: hypothetical protein VF678_13340 [bacterium]
MAKADPKASVPPEVAEQLARLARQYLVHCFLYYRLDEPVAGDAEFDKIAKGLRKLRLGWPKAPMPHAAVIDPVLGPEVSGFQIRKYPPQVISDAFKLLYAINRPSVEFTEFVERRGYKAELGG